MQNISRGSTFRTQLLPRVGAGGGEKEEVGIIKTWMRVPAELNLGPLRAEPWASGHYAAAAGG